MNQRIKIYWSIFFILGLGILSGWISGSGPSEWYQTLHKPSFQPPAFIFGPVWTLLYIMLGIALVKIKEQRPKLLFIFLLQLAFNFIWSPLFFLYHQIHWALLDLSAMVVLNFYLLMCVRKQNTIFLLLLPYNLWLWFALLLNVNIYLLNS